MINPFKYDSFKEEVLSQENKEVLGMKAECGVFINNILDMFDEEANEWWIEKVRKEYKTNFIESLAKLTFYLAIFTEDVVTFNRFLDVDKNDFVTFVETCIASVRYIMSSDTFVQEPKQKDMYGVENIFTALIDEMLLFPEFSENREALLYFIDNGYINDESSTSEYIFAVEKSLGISEFPIYFKNQIYNSTEAYYIIKYCYRVFKANYEEIKTREARVRNIFKMNDDDLLNFVLKFPPEKLAVVVKKGIIEHFSPSELYSFLRDFDNVLSSVESDRSG